MTDLQEPSEWEKKVTVACAQMCPVWIESTPSAARGGAT